MNISMSVFASEQDESASRAESPSQTVVEAVANREGVDAMELTVPLYDAIDPEALDAIVQGDQTDDASSLRIEFSYYGYAVSVAADGSVQVEDAP